MKSDMKRAAQDPMFDPGRYTKDLRTGWNAAAAGYDRISGFFSEFTPEFAGFAEIAPGEKMLDVACGTGLASLEAARRVGAAGAVTAVDLAPEMLRLASAKALPPRGARIEFLEMNAEDLRFPDGRFDAVICQMGLMLFAEPSRALEEMVRVVRRGGRVACLVQGAPDKMIFTSLVMQCVLRHAPQFSTLGGPSLYAFGPRENLARALAGAGLGEVAARRREGSFVFSSAQAYWEIFARGSGRLGGFLRGLGTSVRERIREDCLAEAQKYGAGGKLKIPYEVVMARGGKR